MDLIRYTLDLERLRYYKKSNSQDLLEEGERLVLNLTLTTKQKLPELVFHKMSLTSISSFKVKTLPLVLMFGSALLTRN